MACSALIAILSLVCLFTRREYHLNQRTSSSAINELLGSDVEEGELPSIG